MTTEFSSQKAFLRKMINTNVLATLGVLCMASCTSYSGNDELPFADSIWVPKYISWVSPLPNDEELGEVKYSSFDVIIFKKTNQALIVTSTNSLGELDTISMATEPGLRLRLGDYYCNDKEVIFDCQKQIYTFKMPGRTDKPCEIPKMTWDGNSLFYNGREYIKYSKFNGEPFSCFWKQIEK